ncbi:unnamed protein product, partial [Ceratitis capitata]
MTLVSYIHPKLPQRTQKELSKTKPKKWQKNCRQLYQQPITAFFTELQQQRVEQ